MAVDDPMVDLQADADLRPTEVESLCFNCYKTGTTRLLLTRIAFFREVVVSSFKCEYCGFENRSLEAASRFQDKGVRITLNVESEKDMNRRMFCPAHSTIHLPEFDASFPTSEGDLSTIEGAVLKIIENIELLQPERRASQPEVAAKLEDFIEKLKEILKLKRPFTLILDDPSGNGCIESFLAPSKDPNLTISAYTRSAEQNEALGLATNNDTRDSPIPECEESTSDPPEDEVGKDEVLTFKVRCSNCNAPSETNMKLVDIPHFKQVVIMASVCSACGHRDNEVKSGGGMSPKGRLYRLKLTHPTDLSRDVLVSETAAIRIPELDLESMGGTLGGRFTTLEGLLLAIKDQLMGANQFVLGDSAVVEGQQNKLENVTKKLETIAAGQSLGITFELRDPAGNSYLQNLYAPEPDPEMDVIDYERSAEENDDLGITDMNTENYAIPETEAISCAKS